MGFRILYWVEPPIMGFSSSLSNSAELDEHCSYLLAAAWGPSRDGGVLGAENHLKQTDFLTGKLRDYPKIPLLEN